MSTRVISFHNPLSRQGKSTWLWLTANALALADNRVACMDWDNANPITNDPTLSRFLSPKIPQLFSVYARPDVKPQPPVKAWSDKYLQSLDYVLYDGCHTPDSGLQTILETGCHGAVIPIRDDRGYKTAITEAKTLNRKDVAIHFVLNGPFEPPAEFTGICAAYDAACIRLPELTGVTRLTQSGKTPQMVDGSDAITAAADALASSIVAWLDNLEASESDETNIRAVA
jgi:hypothetical protein